MSLFHVLFPFSPLSLSSWTFSMTIAMCVHHFQICHFVSADSCNKARNPFTPLNPDSNDKFTCTDKQLSLKQMMAFTVFWRSEFKSSELISSCRLWQFVTFTGQNECQKLKEKIPRLFDAECSIPDNGTNLGLTTKMDCNS